MTSRIKKNRPYRSFFAVVGFSLAFILGVNALLVFSLSKTPFAVFEKQEKQQESPAPDPELQVISNSQVTPAQKIIDDLIAFTPSTASNFAIARNVGGTPDSPYAWVCPEESIVAPAISSSKTFTSNENTYVGIIAQAYGAGTGSSAVASHQQSVDSCDTGADGAAYVASRQVPFDTTDGFTAIVLQGSLRIASLTWSQGDVVMTVFGPDSASVNQTAREYNDHLLPLLIEQCVSININDNVSTRSPYFDAVAYTGYPRGRDVILDPMTTPGLSVGAIGTVGSADYSGIGIAVGSVPAEDSVPSGNVIPGAQLEVSDVSLPREPLAPIGSVVLPDPVEEPSSLPAVPVSPGGQVNIPERIKDETGPGCGWAFTGQKAPFYDDVAEKNRVDALVATAQNDLQRASLEYQNQRTSYLYSYATYQTQVASYNEYAQEVQEVAVVWNDINTKRANYRKALDTYYANVTARETFVTRQQQAQVDYDALVLTCQADATRVAQEQAEIDAEVAAARAAAAAPTPSPTTSPTPGSTATPSATETPTATPTPTRTVTPNPDCPAQRPAILDQRIPDEPVVPTKPNVPLPSAWTDVPSEG